MKPAIVFVIAFVATTGASAGAKVMLTKPAHVATAKDSTGADKGAPTDTAVAAAEAAGSAQSDSARAVAAANDTTHAPAIAAATPATSAPAGTVPGAVPAVPSPVAAGVPAGAAPTLPGRGGPAAAGAQPAPMSAATPAQTQIANRTPADTVAERRLSKVFTSMEPEQAAKVLEHMTDGDVQVILGYVGPKQAALIMAALPPERVATLSKLAMRGGK